MLFITLSSAAQGAGEDAKSEAQTGSMLHAPRAYYYGGYPAQRSSIYTGGFNRFVKRSAEAVPASAAAPAYRRAVPYFRRY